MIGYIFERKEISGILYMNLPGMTAWYDRRTGKFEYIRNPEIDNIEFVRKPKENNDLILLEKIELPFSNNLSEGLEESIKSELINFKIKNI